MPGIEEWLSNPLLIVDQKLDENHEIFEKKVREYFEEKVKRNGIHKVQSLNDKPLDEIIPNTLVRFRCMIQDMFEPEYYLARYETVNTLDGTKAMHLGYYRDVILQKPNHEANFNSPENLTKSRKCFYCVPIPGETTWAKRAYAKSSCNAKMYFNDSKSSGSMKRDIDEMEEDFFLHGAMSSSENKKSKTESTNSGNIDNHQFEHNHPLPNEKGPVCLVKVYGQSEMVRLNDVVEFVGVLTVDPELTRFPNQSSSASTSDIINPVMNIDDDNPHLLPSSLVPRLHAIIGYKRQHSNPCLPFALSDLEQRLSEAAQVRERLLNTFKDMLCGDRLAAEYLLLHLISTIYCRADVLAIGKYTLNLWGCPEDTARELYKFIELFLTKCSKFPLSIENLDNSKLVPKKDYKSNRLMTGKLQLSNNTHLIIDETVLEEGRLNENGTANLNVINHVILWQKLPYDFVFYKTDFLTNLNILILSEGKSLLEVDSSIRLNVEYPSPPFEEFITTLDENFITCVRKFIGLAQLINHEITEDVQKYLQNDFVEMRQRRPQEMTSERFHSLLTLARLVAISCGRKNITVEDWSRTKHLEELRIKSIS
ncbi:mini-chromosome maintenance complex-binding protein-like isoform X2 [Xenia sp. Carnegie-2017]|uniref:mini-chromosome maintenance complex-binding protein-like isoform X2 n=1 Tax=Xenia sp. Carnegie-2017 TaxID=2897299 RepID=UPI001F03B392|nr:mini-chromosome maintenance complex-binding protein-like isoform X2 [Xenia sp. Carnegie-2017]